MYPWMYVPWYVCMYWRARGVAQEAGGSRVRAAVALARKAGSNTHVSVARSASAYAREAERARGHGRRTDGAYTGGCGACRGVARTTVGAGRVWNFKFERQHSKHVRCSKHSSLVVRKKRKQILKSLHALSWTPAGSSLSLRRHVFPSLASV